MQLYLIRHGIAADREKYQGNDEERPLIAAGIQKTEKVALRLREIGIRFDLISTSPLVRAYQTAEILLKNDLSDRLETFSPLAPDGDFQQWLSFYLEGGYNDGAKAIAMVGHQPDLANWAELLIWGSLGDRLVLKKAGIIGLELPRQETPLANSSLFLLTSPKWLF